MHFYIEKQTGINIPESMYAPNEKLNVIEHGWGTSAKQKQKEREYNHEYYIKNRDKLLERAARLRQNSDKIKLHNVDYRMIQPENKRTNKDSINGVSRDKLIEKEVIRLRQQYTESNLSSATNRALSPSSLMDRSSIENKPAIDMPTDDAIRKEAETNVDKRIKQHNDKQNRQAQISQGQAYNEYSKQYAMKRKREAENVGIQRRKDRIESNAKWAENEARKYNLKAERTRQEIEKNRPLIQKAQRFIEGHGEYMYDVLHNKKTNAIDDAIKNNEITRLIKKIIKRK